MTIAITAEAAARLQSHIARPGRPQPSVRLFIDHRCHCGKSRFALALDEDIHPDDFCLDVEGVRFVLDSEVAEEAHLAEIDFVRDDWHEGFVIRNREHNCGMHSRA